MSTSSPFPLWFCASSKYYSAGHLRVQRSCLRRWICPQVGEWTIRVRGGDLVGIGGSVECGQRVEALASSWMEEQWGEGPLFPPGQSWWWIEAHWWSTIIMAFPPAYNYTMYTNSACTNIKLSPFKSHFPCFTVWLTLRATLRSGSEVVWGERLLWPFLKIVLLWMKTFLESSQLLNGKPDCLNIKRKIANRFKVQQVGLSKIMKIGADFSYP